MSATEGQRERIIVERVRADEVLQGQRLLRYDTVHEVEVSGTSQGQWCLRLRRIDTGAKQRVWVMASDSCWRVVSGPDLVWL